MPTFKAVLTRDPTGAGTFVRIPRELKKAMGLNGKPKVSAIIAGHPYRGSLMPMGDGTFCLGVLKSIQQAAGVGRGDTITVELELDTAARVVQPPEDLAKVLNRDTGAAARWSALSYTSQKEMARSLEEAKRTDTRRRRLASIVESLTSGRAR
ncbi:MAG TPA: YdeI/OmpD-associated family protein [Candidatus Dormibacteraeota bacterium]|nr:YdeI/OmpD-associated family protein [Candidatus Dormibacteraeota bacterium]